MTLFKTVSLSLHDRLDILLDSFGSTALVWLRHINHLITVFDEAKTAFIALSQTQEQLEHLFVLFNFMVDSANDGDVKPNASFLFTHLTGEIVAFLDQLKMLQGSDSPITEEGLLDFESTKNELLQKMDALWSEILGHITVILDSPVTTPPLGQWNHAKTNYETAKYLNPIQSLFDHFHTIATAKHRGLLSEDQLLGASLRNTMHALEKLYHFEPDIEDRVKGLIERFQKECKEDKEPSPSLANEFGDCVDKNPVVLADIVQRLIDQLDPSREDSILADLTYLDRDAFNALGLDAVALRHSIFAYLNHSTPTSKNPLLQLCDLLRGFFLDQLPLDGSYTIPDPIPLFFDVMEKLAKQLDSIQSDLSEIQSRLSDMHLFMRENTASLEAIHRSLQAPVSLQSSISERHPIYENNKLKNILLKAIPTQFTEDDLDLLTAIVQAIPENVNPNENPPTTSKPTTLGEAIVIDVIHSLSIPDHTQFFQLLNRGKYSTFSAVEQKIIKGFLTKVLNKFREIDNPQNSLRQSLSIPLVDAKRTNPELNLQNRFLLLNGSYTDVSKQFNRILSVAAKTQNNTPLTAHEQSVHTTLKELDESVRTILFRLIEALNKSENSVAFHIISRTIATAPSRFLSFCRFNVAFSYPKFIMAVYAEYTLFNRHFDLENFDLSQPISSLTSRVVDYNALGAHFLETIISPEASFMTPPSDFDSSLSDDCQRFSDRINSLLSNLSVVGSHFQEYSLPNQIIIPDLFFSPFSLEFLLHDLSPHLSTTVFPTKQIKPFIMEVAPENGEFLYDTLIKLADEINTLLSDSTLLDKVQDSRWTPTGLPYDHKPILGFFSKISRSVSRIPSAINRKLYHHGNPFLAAILGVLKGVYQESLTEDHLRQLESQLEGYRDLLQKTQDAFATQIPETLLDKDTGLGSLALKALDLVRQIDAYTIQIQSEMMSWQNPADYQAVRDRISAVSAGERHTTPYHVTQLSYRWQQFKKTNPNGTAQDFMDSLQTEAQKLKSTRDGYQKLSTTHTQPRPFNSDWRRLRDGSASSSVSDREGEVYRRLLRVITAEDHLSANPFGTRDRWSYYGRRSWGLLETVVSNPLLDLGSYFLPQRVQNHLAFRLIKPLASFAFNWVSGPTIYVFNLANLVLNPHNGLSHQIDDRVGYPIMGTPLAHLLKTTSILTGFHWWIGSPITGSTVGTILSNSLKVDGLCAGLMGVYSSVSPPNLSSLDPVVSMALFYGSSRYIYRPTHPLQPQFDALGIENCASYPTDFSHMADSSIQDHTCLETVRRICSTPALWALPAHEMDSVSCDTLQSGIIDHINQRTRLYSNLILHKLIEGSSLIDESNDSRFFAILDVHRNLLYRDLGPDCQSFYNSDLTGIGPEFVTPAPAECHKPMMTLKLFDVMRETASPSYVSYFNHLHIVHNTTWGTVEKFFHHTWNHEPVATTEELEEWLNLLR